MSTVTEITEQAVQNELNFYSKGLFMYTGRVADGRSDIRNMGCGGLYTYGRKPSYIPHDSESQLIAHQVFHQAKPDKCYPSRSTIKLGRLAESTSLWVRFSHLVDPLGVTEVIP